MVLQLGAHHCVTLLGNWLFDHNHEHALPLSRASLNAIMRKTLIGGDFTYVARALVLRPGKSVRKHVNKRKREGGA